VQCLFGAIGFDRLIQQNLCCVIFSKPSYSFFSERMLRSVVANLDSTVPRGPPGFSLLLHDKIINNTLVSGKVTITLLEDFASLAPNLL